MPSISVIIPTLNEAANIGAAIECARLSSQTEVIVVDGGSRDETVSAASLADRVLQTTAGRAVQQNAGANAATGEFLLFLHADCRLTPGFDEAILDTLNESNCVAACFTQRVERPGIVYRMIESGNAWRVRMCGWIYGDQGLCLRKHTFDTLGQFPELALMEDLYFSKQLKRAGKLRVCRHPLLVSARRWEQQGVIRQTLRNWAFIAAVHLGISPNQLARHYGHVRDV